MNTTVVEFVQPLNIQLAEPRPLTYLYPCILGQHGRTSILAEEIPATKNAVVADKEHFPFLHKNQQKQNVTIFCRRLRRHHRSAEEARLGQYLLSIVHNGVVVVRQVLSVPTFHLEVPLFSFKSEMLTIYSATQSPVLRATTQITGSEPDPNTSQFLLAVVDVG